MCEILCWVCWNGSILVFNWVFRGWVLWSDLELEIGNDYEGMIFANEGQSIAKHTTIDISVA